MSNNVKQHVTKCKNSNLIEVWTLIEGGIVRAPQSSQFILDTVGALTRNIRTHFFKKKGIEFEEKQRIGVIATTKPGGLIGPFWDRELKWVDGKGNIKILRLGYNCMSFHTVHDPQKPYTSYTSYEQDLGEFMNDILSVIHDDNMFSIKRIAFRYVNLFEFNKTDLNLPDYFDVKFGLGISNQAVPLSKFSTQCEFVLNQNRINLDFTVDTVPNIITLVETTVKKSFASEEESVKYNDKEKLLAEISELRKEAKEVFFGCATTKTKDMLGVEYE